MKNDFKHSDKHLQEKVEDFRMAAPEGSWAGIESQIGNNSKVRRRFFWLILLFVGLTGGVLSAYFYFNTQENNSVAATKTSLSQNTVSSKNTPSSSSEQPHAPSLGNSQTYDLNSTEDGIHGSQNEPQVSNSDSGKLGQEVTNKKSQSGKGSDSYKTVQNNDTGINSGAPGVSNFDKNTALHASQKENNNDSNNHVDGSSDKSTFSDTPKDSDTEEKDSGSKDSNTSENKNGVKSKNALNDLKLRRYSPIASYNTNLLETPKDFDRSFKRKGVWSIEAGIDGSGYYYSIQNTVDTALTPTPFLNSSFRQIRGYGAYANINYRPFNRISFQSGLAFSQESATQEYVGVTQTTSVQYDTVGFFIDTTTQQQIPIIDSSMVNTNSYETFVFNSSISQLNIPIGVMFHFPIGRRSEFGVNLSGLVGIRTGASGQIVVDQNGNSIPTSEMYRTINFSSRLALRYSYLLNERTAVYLEPHAGIGLNNRAKVETTYKARFQKAGIRVGFHYTF